MILEQNGREIGKEFVRISKRGVPSPAALVEELNNICGQNGIDLILIDGPQGWKATDSDLQHCRRCERTLNTPAKTGAPGSVKPAPYTKFVEFSIDVYDELCKGGWHRLAGENEAPGHDHRILVESFPYAAWRSLGIKPLPGKARSRPEDIAERYATLRDGFSVESAADDSRVNHDELQALISGLAGLAIEHNSWRQCSVVGIPPMLEDGCWREGFIVSPVFKDSHSI